MAKRHSADDELSAALAILTEIEAATTEWLPEKASLPVDAETDDVSEARQVEPVQVAQQHNAVSPNAAIVAALIDTAAGQASPLVHFVRNIDADIQRTIVQANDAEVLPFHAKLLRRLRLSRMPQNMQRRDDVLASRLFSSLDRAARLIAALDGHRQVMRARLSRVEDDLIVRIERTKAMGDETSAIADAAEQLTNRQDFVEALIRHEAACNSLYHKLVIEAERGIVVLRALNAGQGASLSERFSFEAKEVLSPLLALGDKGMLSMREVDRRKQTVDEHFRLRFSPAPAHHAETGDETRRTPQMQQASA